MAKEHVVQGVIFKKQLFRETDELITVYTEEYGKLRVLAKGVKKPTSKLQYSVQTLNLVRLTLTQGSLPVVISAEVIHSFAVVRSSHLLVSLFYWIAELVLKSTPDGEPNARLFGLCRDSLQFLDTNPSTLTFFKAQFLVQFLEAIGLTVHEAVFAEDQLYFSNSTGGFTNTKCVDAIPIPVGYPEIARHLRTQSFHAPIEVNGSIEDLFMLLSGFVSYHIERTIYATKYVYDAKLTA